MKSLQGSRSSKPSARQDPLKVRFEATIHATRRVKREDWVTYLDVDRVPDPKGRVRALLTADDCVRLLNQGLEVRLHHAHAIHGLDPALIATDEAVRRWLDEELKGLSPRQGKKG